MNVQRFGIGEMSWTTVDQLIELTNKHAGDKDFYIRVYLNSNGGIVSAMEAIIDILNEHDHDIYLNSAESCAFDLLFQLNGPIFINDQSYAMYHLGAINIKYRDGMIEDSVTQVQKDIVTKEGVKTKEVMNKLGFTDMEKATVNAGNDLYIGAKRLREMFRYKDAHLLIDAVTSKDDACGQISNHGYVPLPYCVKIADSEIHGQGLVATRDIEATECLGISHIDAPNDYLKRELPSQLIRTPLGGFINHCDTPNTKLIYDRIGFYNLVTIEDIKEGEEITLNYYKEKCGVKKE